MFPHEFGINSTTGARNSSHCCDPFDCREKFELIVACNAGSYYCRIDCGSKIKHKKLTYIDRRNSLLPMKLHENLTMHLDSLSWASISFFMLQGMMEHLLFSCIWFGLLGFKIYYVLWLLVFGLLESLQTCYFPKGHKSSSIESRDYLFRLRLLCLTLTYPAPQHQVLKECHDCQSVRWR